MLSDERIPSISEFEDQIARELTPTIRPFLDLLADTYSFSGKVIRSGFPEQKPILSKQVLTRLLLRLNNDLRAIYLLANVGYDVQANAVAASVYECAFTMCAISDNNEMAAEWLDWDDPKKTYKDAYTLTALGLKELGKSDWISHFYRIYRQLCWGKHLNPISEQQGGIERDENIIEYLPGPRADDLTSRGICFCCTHTAILAFLGLQTYIEKHTLLQNKGAVIKELNELGRRQFELYQEGLKRWGSEDPFPGKW